MEISGSGRPRTAHAAASGAGDEAGGVAEAEAASRAAAVSPLGEAAGRSSVASVEAAGLAAETGGRRSPSGEAAGGSAAETAGRSAAGAADRSVAGSASPYISSNGCVMKIWCCHHRGVNTTRAAMRTKRCQVRHFERKFTKILHWYMGPGISRY